MQKRKPNEAPRESPGQDLSRESLKLLDFEPADERAIIETLASAFPRGWHGGEVWRWKHIERPGFKPSEVVTVKKGEEMAACFHGATLPFKLEPGLTVNMSFDGDFAVVPAHRGRNIPARAHDLTDRRLLAAGVALRGGFTSKALNERFYSKFGYGFAPTSTLRFRKIIGLRPIQEKIETLGQRILAREKVRQILARKPIAVNLLIRTLPACHLLMTKEAFIVNPGTLERANMSIRAPYALIVRLTMGPWKFAASAILSLLSFKLRVRGLMRMSGPMLSLAWAFVQKP